MSRMLAIRYVTLAALVIWLGGMVTLAVLTTPSADVLQQFRIVEYVCGAIVFLCLIVLKFVGPPPHDFFPRIGLVAAMLLVTVYPGASSRASLMINIAVGFVLLSWYARE
jgi:hypothetical protein